MNKTQVILVVVAVLLVFGLYSLPRVVVDNDSAEEQTFIDETVPGGVIDHSSEIPEEILPRVNFWKDQLLISGEIQPNIEALDSLMLVFQTINKYDSAAFYADLFAKKFNELKHWQKAGDAYFEAFTFALDKAKIDMLGAKAKEAYDKILAVEPNNNDVRHNVAMILVSSTSPMQGIMMLRSIIEDDPKNEKALMSMGRMSIQTGQYQNGVERFESLIGHYPDHIEGNFFLGVCYYETGQLEKAKAQFNKVKNLGAEEQLLTAVEEYLERIS